MLNIKIEGLVPSKAHASDAAYDLMAAKDVVIFSQQRMLVPCGFKMELPSGYAALICARSGLALKRGISVVNGPGIIDSGYRGEIGAILYNSGPEIFEIKKGDRVAQMLIYHVPETNLVPGVLSESDRGAGGFGSSGR